MATEGVELATTEYKAISGDGQSNTVQNTSNAPQSVMPQNQNNQLGFRQSTNDVSVCTQIRYVLYVYIYMI